MGKFFKPKQIDEIMQFRSGAGYLILKTSDNEVTHCEVYSAGGMLRRVSDGKPVEMQFTDDEQIYTVSTDTNLKLITRLEATISELQAALKTTIECIKEKGYGDVPEVAAAYLMVERAELNETIAGVLKDIVVTLHRMGYCCCGQDRGKPIIATFCPKHGATVLNSGGALEYPLDDAHAHVHFLATGCSCRQSAGDSPTCHVHHLPEEKPES